MVATDRKRVVVWFVAVAAAFVLAYTVDQYYIAGRGYTFFFDILKL